jgi:hypothetical protein
MDFLEFAVRQVANFMGGRGVKPGVIDAAEQALGVRLPGDVRPIAAVFRGGRIGEKLDHFSWSLDDPINVVERTRHFREQGLPEDGVAVAVGGRVLHAIIFAGTGGT